MRKLIVLAVSLSTLAGRAEAQDLAIERWLVRGPVPADTGRVGLLRDYLDGEASVLPTLGDEGWREVESDAAARVDLNEAFVEESTAWSVVYAHAYVFAPEDRTVLLIADSDDDLVVYANGQRVWVNLVARGLGSGSDTVGVRLGEGWNAVLLKVRNRTGGFGLLGRLAPGESAGLAGILQSPLKPPGLIAHVHPQPTVTVGPLLLGAALRWIGGELLADGRTALTAWGPLAFGDVTLELSRGDEVLLRTSYASLAPGAPAQVDIRLPFRALRAAALGVTPLVATARWRGGSYRRPLFVSADRLLRLAGGRVELGDLEVDSVGERPQRLGVSLVVPQAFDGSSLGLLAMGLGATSRYQVNGRPMTWRDGQLELCAPCRRGDSLRVEITPESERPLWLAPLARVREIGYPEYADGYEYAKSLAGRAPAIVPPNAPEWLRVLGEPGGAAYRALAERYQRAYAPLAAEIRRDTLHLIGNSHIDAAWLWPWSETIEVIRDTWRTSLKLAEIFPGYIFTGSAAAYYDAMDRMEPALSDSLAAAVAAGRWVPVGGWWVESDLNLPNGESLVRQGLYGQRYMERRFGRRARVAWTPDCFGYPWTIPQILAGAGLEYFVTQKIRWNDSTEFPYNAFYWEGRDGTRTLTYNPYGYVHDLDPRRLVRERVEDRERTDSNHQIVLYGVGDHGGGPTIEMLQRAEDLRRVPTYPALVYDEPLSALQALQGREARADLPVWRDELYLEYHRGTYTTQARSKWRNRRSEVLLKTAEALATVSEAPYPRSRLEAAWRLVLFNQFHDILPGSGIRAVYDDAELFYDSAWAMIDSVTRASFAELRSRLDTRGRGGAAVIFNPLGWPRDGTVMLPGEGGDSLRVTVLDVPAYGARVVRVPRDTLPKEVRRLAAPRAGPGWIENAYLRVEIDTLTGEIVRLYDKANRRDALAPGGRANVLQLFDDRPDQWDAWNIVITGERWDVKDVRRTGASASPRMARLEIVRRWGNSEFRQTLVLERAARYLDVRNEVDWGERRKLLKVAFELGIDADSATYEIPYGTIGRTGRPLTQAERAKFEVPGQRWADVSGGGYGVSVLNDSKYGWDYRGNVLRLSLLRAPIWPDSLADRGRHRFRFAVYPHAGDWREAGTVRLAAEYNTPLVAALEPEHRGPLGRQISFASADPANVELAWLKRAEEGEDWVLRLVEWHGQPAEAEVTLGCEIAGARRTNLLEDPGEPVISDGKRLRTTLRPYEIATLKVECER